MKPLPTSWHSASDDALRAIRAEQRRLSEREEQSRLFRDFLIEIAPSLVGHERWQKIVAESGEPPELWSNDKWRSVFYSVRFSIWDAETLKKRIEETEEHLAAAREEARALRRELWDARGEAETLAGEVDELKSMLHAWGVHAATCRTLLITGAAERTPDPWAVDWPVVDPAPPAKYADRLGKGEQWRRQALFLYVLGTKGWSLQFEILLVLGEVEGFGPDSGTAGRLVRKGLARSGFITREHLYLGMGPDGRRRCLAVVRLTEDGRALCRALGWEPVESDWERLIRLHQGKRQRRHAAAVLAFAFHARRRGWQAYVVPEVKSRVFRPDVLVERDGERYYVEVERRLGLRQKWLNQMRYQKCIAFCTTSKLRRREMVIECEHFGFYGWATDLETLDRQLQTYGWGPLWVDEVGDMLRRYYNMLWNPLP